MKVQSLVLAAACCLFVARAQAQYYYGYPYSYHHASTAAEGYARGMADVVRSAGEYRLRRSEAAINYEQARSKRLDNRLKATNTYFEMRRINKEYRDANRRARLPREDLYRIARENLPDRLSPTQLDPLNGVIFWPPVLLNDPFAAQRKKVEALFAQRAASPTGPSSYGDIKEATEVLQNNLKSRIDDYDTREYLDARRFIESLAYEGRFVSG